MDTLQNMTNENKDNEKTRKDFLPYVRGTNDANRRIL